MAVAAAASKIDFLAGLNRFLFVLTQVNVHQRIADPHRDLLRASLHRAANNLLDLSLSNSTRPATHWFNAPIPNFTISLASFAVNPLLRKICSTLRHLRLPAPRIL